jgi:hypothetical protein
VGFAPQVQIANIATLHRVSRLRLKGSFGGIAKRWGLTSGVGGIILLIRRRGTAIMTKNAEYQARWRDRQGGHQIAAVISTNAYKKLLAVAERLECSQREAIEHMILNFEAK